jgi:hypothetical protein
MKEWLILLGVVVLWIALNRWILPWFGIPTCMSGGCAADRCRPHVSNQQNSDNMDVLPSKRNQR